MAERTLAQRLAIKPGARVWLSDAGRASALGTLPSGAARVETLEGADAALLFADSAAAARRLLGDNGAALAGLASFWVAYPKGNRADINRDTLWPILAEHGFRPIGQVALDDTWSALRFRPLAEGEAPFSGGR